jgi:chromosome segregation ATPase
VATLEARTAEVNALRQQLSDMALRHSELAGRVNALEDERRALTASLAEVATAAGPVQRAVHAVRSRVPGRGPAAG